VTTKQAAHAAAWRERHPDRYERSKRRQAARRRAMRRLAELHPDDLDRLYAQALLEEDVRE
jgi:hypothetical protein